MCCGISAPPSTTATLERLRIDLQLEEALICGADPCTSPVVFGTGDTTAIKYATIARQLLQTTADQHHSSSSREPGTRTARNPRRPPVPAADPWVRRNSGQSHRLPQIRA